MTPTQTTFDLSGNGQSTTPRPAAPVAPLPPALPVTGGLLSDASSLPNLPAGTGLCYCTVCGLYFKSETSFTMHRPGDYEVGKPRPRCLTPDEMIAKGMARNAKGQWVTRLYDGPPRGPQDEAGDE